MLMSALTTTVSGFSRIPARLPHRANFRRGGEECEGAKGLFSSFWNKLGLEALEACYLLRIRSANDDES
jgi:hypothetical protein